MPIFNHDGIETYYEVRGNGIPFLFLHGLGGSTEQINNVYEDIEGIKLITFDQRGHGKSKFRIEKMDFGILSKDVIALANYLGLKEFYLGGISMGAAVSVRTALNYQERLKGLILIRNAWINDRMNANIRDWFHTAAKYLKQYNGNTEFIKTKQYKEIYSLSFQTANSFLGYFNDNASTTSYEKFDIMPECKPFEKLEELENLNVKTLIMTNKYDPVHPYQYGRVYKQHIPGAKLYEITSKEVNKQRHHRELNQYLRAFLK